MERAAAPVSLRVFVPKTTEYMSAQPTDPLNLHRAPGVTILFDSDIRQWMPVATMSLDRYFSLLTDNLLRVFEQRGQSTVASS